MDNLKSIEAYNEMPILDAVIKNALPAVAAMLMVLIYNLADTFFIAQTDNAYQVAAVSLATPVFLIFMSIGSIFGIGGTSVISRSFGEGNKEYAKKVSAFCMWSSTILGILTSVVLIIFMEPILNFLGASGETYEYTKTYLTIVSLCGPFAIISSCFSNILRADGQPAKAMNGQIIGNALNLILDAVLIIGFDLDIVGCALATLIGETTGALYYIYFLIKGDTSLSVNLKDFKISDKILKNVFMIGVPASLGTLLMSFSSIIVNSQMANYSDMAVAGMGVAMKIVMITGMISMGIGMGIQPLLGYCVGSKNWKRFKEYMRFSILFTFTIGTVMTGICYLSINQLVGVFLEEKEAFDYGVKFARILLSTGPLFGVFYILTNSIQAIGASVPSLIINISRQGLIYIPMLIILNNLLGINGLVWAQPLVDIISVVMAIFIYLNLTTKMMNESESNILNLSINRV